MLNVSSDERVSLLVIAVTVGVFAWLRSDGAAIEQWLDATLALIVSLVVAGVTLYALNWLDPRWYSS